MPKKKRLKGQCPFTWLAFSIAAQLEKVNLGSPSFMVGKTQRSE
jgi:hypothetical protein